MPKVRFEVECPGAEKVYLAGDFNEWSAEKKRMKRVRKGEDVFLAVLDLEPGTWQFRYIVDGAWTCCPLSETVPNEFGELNSVMEVPAQ